MNQYEGSATGAREKAEAATIVIAALYQGGFPQLRQLDLQSLSLAYICWQRQRYWFLGGEIFLVGLQDPLRVEERSGILNSGWTPWVDF